MNPFVCSMCGHVEFGSAPELCPVCFASKDKFQEKPGLFEESAEKSKEAAVKHIPAITINKQCGLIPNQGCMDVVVRVGQTVHPMEEKHFIKFVDCYVDDRYVSRVMLSPSMFPGACFHLKATGSKVRIVERCNVHGYWNAEAVIE